MVDGYDGVKKMERAAGELVDEKKELGNYNGESVSDAKAEEFHKAVSEVVAEFKEKLDTFWENRMRSLERVLAEQDEIRRKHQLVGVLLTLFYDMDKSEAEIDSLKEMSLENLYKEVSKFKAALKS